MRAVAARLALSRLHERCPDGRGNFYGHETIRGEQVILAAFIDDPQVAVALGVFIRQDGVNLVALEGCLVAVIPNADGEPAPRDGFAPLSRGISCA